MDIDITNFEIQETTSTNIYIIKLIRKRTVTWLLGCRFQSCLVQDGLQLPAPFVQEEPEKSWSEMQGSKCSIRLVFN